jgi:hypothetical protein
MKFGKILGYRLLILLIVAWTQRHHTVSAHAVRALPAFSDEDLASVVVYPRALPPVRNSLPRPKSFFRLSI